MPNAVCMPLLHEPATLTADGLRAAWRSTWPDVPLGDVVEEKDGALAFGAGDARCAVTLAGAPVPGDEVIRAASLSWLWPGAEGAVARGYGAHAVVVATHDDALAAAAAASRAAAVVLAATGGLGVYVGSAWMVVRADTWTATTRGVDRPLRLWVNAVAAKVGRDHSAAYTVGLGALGLREIEVVRSLDEPGRLRAWLLEVAADVARGAVFADGHTLGGEGDGRIVVRHAPSSFGRPGTVYLLEMGA